MSRERGDWGEALVANYLRDRGYELLAHSYRCRFGEIDLIAKKKTTLCFVEVKLRADTQYGLPREAVTASKQEKIKKTAQMYMSARGLDMSVRFDVAEVYADAAGDAKKTKIEYLENAFI